MLLNNIMKAGAVADDKLMVEDVFNTTVYTGHKPDYTMRAVAVNATGKFVAVGYIYTDSYPVFSTSTDGANWTAPALMNGSSVVARLNSVAVDSNGRFVAVGSNASGYPIFATSTDGTTWTPPALMNGSSVVANMLAITVNSSGKFVAVGTNGGSTDLPIYATSTNGTTWTTPALMNGSSVCAVMKAITVNSSGRFVAVGYNQTMYGVFATSTDGSTWTTPALFNGSGTNSGMYAVSVNSSGRFVSMGFNASAYPLYSTSTDGTTWTTPAYVNGSSAYATMYSLSATSSGGFVAVGCNASGYAMTATSTDGTSWTTPAVINGISFSSRLFSVCMNSSGKFAAVGYNASYYPMFATSSDGSTWTTPQQMPTITTGIDLTGGSMIWLKSRSAATDHAIYDTVRGATYDLASNLTTAQTTQATGVTGFGSTGFSMGALAKINTSAATYAAWTFKKAAKFFDVVTYNGDNNIDRQIPHSLGCAPGFIIIKRTNDSSAAWCCYHRSIGTGKALILNQNYATLNNANYYRAVTSEYFSPGDDGLNFNSTGGTYIAYLFAHDDSADGVVQCGSFTTDGSGNATVSLGWEPQYVMAKCSSTTEQWYLLDSMRAFSVTGNNILAAESTMAETNGTSPGYSPTATGFNVLKSANRTYIYLAIRRGPMRTPTDGTKVYNAIARTGTGAAATVTGVGFAPDVVISMPRTPAGYGTYIYARLQGAGRAMPTFNTGNDSVADATCVTGFDVMDGIKVGIDNYACGINYSSGTYITNFFRRAPGFFDQVCYTGTGVARTIVHNLGSVPGMIWVKCRSSTLGWFVHHNTMNSLQVAGLNTTDSVPSLGQSSNYWNSALPTSSVFSLGTDQYNNGSAKTYVAYLFGDTAGLCKAFSYTGNGTNQNIALGFAPRFVIIKCYNNSGDWKVFDSTRGIVSGNDPVLALNSTAAEVTTTDPIDPIANGFNITQEATNNLNVNGATYIGWACA